MTLVSIPVSHVSDGDGQFEFRAPVGTLIEASHQKFGVAKRRLTQDAVSRGTMTLVLKPAPSGAERRSISGIVVDEHDVPIPDAELAAAHDGSSPFDEFPSWASAHADAEGC